MAKSAQAFRTIREVADWLDVAAHVLRFWESKFSQIKPVKRAGGRRYYRPADMELVGGIKVLLHDRGLTIRGVQKLISEDGLEAVTALSPPLDDLIEDDEIVAGEALADESLADGSLADVPDDWQDDTAAEVLGTPLARALLGQKGEDDTATSDTPSDTPSDQTSEEPSLPDVSGGDEQDPATPTAPETDAAEPEPEPEPQPGPAPDLGPVPEVAASATDVAADAPRTETDTPMPDFGRLPSSGPADGRAPPAHPARPGPADEPTPPEVPPTAPAATPATDPAEGTLGTLTTLAQLPAARRAALRPHIAALARLRDRMSAPADNR